MVYALIAEPVDPVVDVERLRYRQAYSLCLSSWCAKGSITAAFAAQDATVSAAALVGVIAEALTGPLSTQTPAGAEGNLVIAAIQAFCLRAVGAAA